MSPASQYIPRMRHQPRPSPKERAAHRRALEELEWWQEMFDLRMKCYRALEKAEDKVLEDIRRIQLPEPLAHNPRADVIPAFVPKEHHGFWDRLMAFFNRGCL